MDDEDDDDDFGQDLFFSMCKSIKINWLCQLRLMFKCFLHLYSLCLLVCLSVHILL